MSNGGDKLNKTDFEIEVKKFFPNPQGDLVFYTLDGSPYFKLNIDDNFSVHFFRNEWSIQSLLSKNVKAWTGKTLEETYNEIGGYLIFTLSQGCKVTSVINLLQSLIEDNPDLTLAEEITIQAYPSEGLTFT